MPVSQLDQVASLKCLTPLVDASIQVCNGIPQNEAGLIENCPFSDSPFDTCVCALPYSQNLTGILITVQFSTDAQPTILHQQNPIPLRITPRDKHYVTEVSSPFPVFSLILFVVLNSLCELLNTILGPHSRHMFVLTLELHLC